MKLIFLRLNLQRTLDKILIKNLYHLKKGYKEMKLTNKFSNKCWTKSSINRLLKKFAYTNAVNRLAYIAADHEVPAIKKMLTWLTILF